MLDLQERAAKWRTSDGLMDGLTTNGVLVMHPAGEFVSEAAPGVWREISVCGNVFALRETRSAQQRGKLVRICFNLGNEPPVKMFQRYTAEFWLLYGHLRLKHKIANFFTGRITQEIEFSELYFTDVQHRYSVLPPWLTKVNLLNDKIYYCSKVVGQNVYF